VPAVRARGVPNPSSQIAKALTLSIGKIARLDYDADWPTLPDELLQLIAVSLQDPSRSRHLHRSLMAVKSVVAALVENRMPRGRKIMQKVRAQALPATVCRVWVA
jgi:hypothetical protein